MYRKTFVGAAFAEATDAREADTLLLADALDALTLEIEALRTLLTDDRDALTTDCDDSLLARRAD